MGGVHKIQILIRKLLDFFCENSSAKKSGGSGAYFLHFGKLFGGLLEICWEAFQEVFDTFWEIVDVIFHSSLANVLVRYSFLPTVSVEVV